MRGGRYPIVNLHVEEPDDVSQQEVARVHDRSLQQQLVELENRVRFEREYMTTMMGSVLVDIEEVANASRSFRREH